MSCLERRISNCHLPFLEIALDAVVGTALIQRLIRLIASRVRCRSATSANPGWSGDSTLLGSRVLGIQLAALP
jgi:hypothetical protein